MLELSIVRGPLNAGQQEEILREFNRLTNSRIKLPEFRRWVQEGPEGPAFHAILTSGARIVGHFCLIPLQVSLQGKSIPAARTEYFFVHEDFRSEKVRGFDDSFLSPAILLLELLYRHCHSYGWGPFLASVAEDIQPFHELVGCRPVDFRLHECLFVLRPVQAAGNTPNLRKAQRAALFTTSLAQAGLWTVAGRMFPRDAVKPTSIDQVPEGPTSDKIGFFEREASRVWRYPDGEYIVLGASAEPASYVIAKNGSGDRYLRVCQWQIGSTSLVPGFVRALMDFAQEKGMLGVRWAVYENEQQSAGLLRSIRKLAFLCVPRVRRLLVYTEDASFLESSTWRFSDSFFCFDL
jgi:hypothetical protein